MEPIVTSCSRGCLRQRGRSAPPSTDHAPAGPSVCLAGASPCSSANSDTQVGRWRAAMPMPLAIGMRVSGVRVEAEGITS